MNKIAKAHGKEVALAVVVLGGLGTAIGLAIRRNAHHLEEVQLKLADPSILLSEKFSPEQRARINRVAAFILLNDQPNRKEIMKTLELTKNEAQDAIGYLKDKELIKRTQGVVPGSGYGYYAPSPSLVLAALESAKNESAYPELAAAVQEFQVEPNES